MHRRLSRPRTKVYDSCYTMGEAYYKSALDDLDRKSGKRVSSTPTRETIEPPSMPPRGRPASVADVESMMKDAAAKMTASEETDDALAETLKRIRMARTATVASPEESFETAYNQRREEVKRRFSEKMLNAVGINGVSEEDSISQLMSKRRAARMIREAEEVVAPTKWTALAIADENAEIQAAGAAAGARALMSRSRLADLEREMEDIDARSMARQRRVAALRSLASEEESSSSQALSSSLKASMKKMTVTTTTTKASY